MLPKIKPVNTLLHLLAALALALALPAHAAEPAASKWDAYVEQYLESYFKAHPAFAVYKGRHEFDGQLPDWSAAGIAAEIARLKQQRAEAAAFAAEALTA